MKYFDYTSTVAMDDSNIVVTAFFQNGSKKVDTVVRDGSQVTNFKTAVESHRQIALSVGPSSRSAPCSVSTPNRWAKNQAAGAPTGTVVSAAQPIIVPPGNSGNLTLRIDVSSGTAKYSIAGGAFTTFTDGTSITVTNGQTLAIEALTLGAQDSLNGTVEDGDTGSLVDNIALFNSSSAP